MSSLSSWYLGLGRGVLEDCGYFLLAGLHQRVHQAQGLGLGVAVLVVQAPDYAGVQLRLLAEVARLGRRLIHAFIIYKWVES